MARSFIVYQGEDETPEFDLTEPDSPVHVIWEEIEAGGRGYRGESASSSIPLRDEQGGTGNELSLPSGIDFISLSRGSRWEWMEGTVRMAAGRIGAKDYTRGRQKADRAREVVMSCADRNEELTEIIVDDWVRDEELDYVRVEALRAAYLDGDPRVTTVIAGTYIAAANGVTLPAKTYDGTDPKGVLSEIAQLTNKLFFVTVDDELFYDVPESTAYQAGIRISDRLDELNTTGSCSSGTPVVEASAGYSGGTVNSTLALTVGSEANTAIYAAMHSNTGAGALASDALAVTWCPNGINLGTPGLGTQEFTKIATVSVDIEHEMAIFRLLAPTPSGEPNSFIHYEGSTNNIGGFWFLSGVNQSTPETDTSTASGSSGSSSSVTVTADSGDLILDVTGWRHVNASVVNPDATAGQTEDWTNTLDNSVGNWDFGGAGGSGTDPTPTWDYTNTFDLWCAAAVAVSGGGAGGGDGTTFPPIWDVGPSSTEDGLQLVSGLRLYYGSAGAYVYVNHAGTEAEYWHAERSFYTHDPSIDDSTKATALATAILTRLRFEERTYNVSIGPLSEDQVGCIKYGQLIEIKARAIPDADDQFVSRRIAQLKWTTPRPGVFFARMQLDRPIKEVPYGVGPKEGHDALEQHKEGDSHPASAIVVTPFDTIAATDVQAALEEIFDEASGGGMTNPMTTAGDLIVGGASGTPGRLAKGTDGQVLKMASGNVTWGTDATGGGGGGWDSTLDLSGATFTGWTAEAGTWSSDGTIIQKTNTVTGAHERAYNTTKVPWGAGFVAEVEIRFPTTGQGAGANVQAGFIMGHVASTTSRMRLTLNRGGPVIQVEEDAVSVVKTWSQTINLDTWYRCRLLSLGGPYVSVYVDGTLVGSISVEGRGFGGGSADLFALVTFNALADFRNIKVWTLTQP